MSPITELRVNPWTSR